MNDVRIVEAIHGGTDRRQAHPLRGRGGAPADAGAGDTPASGSQAGAAEGGEQVTTGLASEFKEESHGNDEAAGRDAAQPQEGGERREPQANHREAAEEDAQGPGQAEGEGGEAQAPIAASEGVVASARDRVGIDLDHRRLVDEPRHVDHAGCQADRAEHLAVRASDLV